MAEVADSGFCVAVQGVGKFLSVLFWMLLLAFLLLDGMVIRKVPALTAGWEIFVTGLVAWYIVMATLAKTVTRGRFCRFLRYAANCSREFNREWQASMGYECERLTATVTLSLS
jgi:hypothetical protein